MIEGPITGGKHGWAFAATLASLCRDEAAYLATFEQAERRAVRAGVMLMRDLTPSIEEAAREYRRAQHAQSGRGERRLAAAGPA